MRLAQPDWLQHRLTITGPAEPLAAFRRAAAGPGIVPWWHDADRLAEDWFHLMLAPPADRRSISAAGARMLSGQLRDAVWEEHERAMSRMGTASVALDLHALQPVPARLLRCGADDPGSLAWLWQNWGTTWPLRRVRLETGPAGDAAAFCCSFWSADWTPWPVIASIRTRWPTLRLSVMPSYFS